MRLQKLLLCLSRHRTLTYLDKIGEKHDAKVLEWCANIEDTLRASKVSIPSKLIVQQWLRIPPFSVCDNRCSRRIPDEPGADE